VYLASNKNNFAVAINTQVAGRNGQGLTIRADTPRRSYENDLCGALSLTLFTFVLERHAIDASSHGVHGHGNGLGGYDIPFLFS